MRSRRLKYLVIFLCFLFSGCAASGQKDIAVSDHVVKHESSGFLMELPKGWYWMDDPTYRYNNTALILKHKEPYSDWNPQITINLRRYKEEAPAQLAAVKSQLNRVQENSRTTIVDGPRMVKVGNYDAAYGRYNHYYQVPSGLEFYCSREIYYFVRDSYMYWITTNTRVDEKTGSREEIRRILESISLDAEY